MDNLPIELIQEISHYLPLNYLITINKKFTLIYDEIYYYKYLQTKYPNKKLWLRSSYKELCKIERSQRPRLIYGSHHNYYLERPGIDHTIILSHLDNSFLILDFNGDIYWNYSDSVDDNGNLDESNNEFPIDSHVTEINTTRGNGYIYTYYIKEGNKYYITHPQNKCIIVIINKPYVSIEADDNYLFVDNYIFVELLDHSIHKFNTNLYTDNNDIVKIIF